MAEGNSQLNNLLEENETSELPSHIEGADELSPPSQKEGDGGKEVSKKKKKKAKSKKKKELREQTDPPSISVLDLFPSGDFPEGEIQQYKDDNLWRTTSEEKRELERLQKPLYNSVRRAAEVHRQVVILVLLSSIPFILMDSFGKKKIIQDCHCLLFGERRK